MVNGNLCFQALIFFFTVNTLCSRSHAFPANLIIEPKSGQCNGTIISEQDIYDFIFKNYTKEVRPRRDHSKPVEVLISLNIDRITDFIEVDSTLILNGYIHMSWDNDYTAWESTFPYNCVDYITLRPDMVWVPDMVITNSAERTDSFLSAASQNLRLTILKNGTTQYDPAGSLAVTCELDLRDFPFDVQSCHVRIESSNYVEKHQTFILTRMPFVRLDDLWLDNRRWEVVKNESAIQHLTYYDDMENTYSNVVFTLYLRRKSLFYYISIIVPSFTIAVVELVTFAMPIMEVSKFNFSVMCLLAYSVFQSAIASDMPRISDIVPLLSLYISLQMIFIALIPLLGEGLVFLIAGYAETKKEKPPKILFRFWRMIGCLLLVNTRRLRAASASAPPPSSQNSISTIEETKLAKKRTARIIYARWIYIAETMERANLLAYVLALCLTPVILLVFQWSA